MDPTNQANKPGFRLSWLLAPAMVTVLLMASLVGILAANSGQSNGAQQADLAVPAQQILAQVQTATSTVTATATLTATGTVTTTGTVTVTRTVTGTLTATRTAVGMTATPGATGTAEGKVTLCHRTGSQSNPYNEITVGQSALPDHQAHGDLYPVPPGGCPREAGATRTAGTTGTPAATRTPMATGTPAPSTTSGVKVNVCHRTESAKNPYNLISISQSALPAHQAHGDLYPVPAGGCPAAATATPRSQAPKKNVAPPAPPKKNVSPPAPPKKNVAPPAPKKVVPPTPPANKPADPPGQEKKDDAPGKDNGQGEKKGKK